MMSVFSALSSKVPFHHPTWHCMPAWGKQGAVCRALIEGSSPPIPEALAGGGVCVAVLQGM